MTDSKILVNNKLSSNVYKKIENLYLKPREVANYLSIAISTLYYIRHNDPSFPKAKMLSTKRPVFSLREIEEWVMSKNKELS